MMEAIVEEKYRILKYLQRILSKTKKGFVHHFEKEAFRGQSLADDADWFPNDLAYMRDISTVRSRIILVLTKIVIKLILLNRKTGEYSDLCAQQNENLKRILEILVELLQVQISEGLEIEQLNDTLKQESLGIKWPPANLDNIMRPDSILILNREFADLIKNLTLELVSLEKPSKNIVYATDFYFGTGGGETAIKWQTEVLRDAGYNVSVLVPGDNASRGNVKHNVVKGVHVHEVFKINGFFPVRLFELWRQGKKDAKQEYEKNKREVLPKEFNDIFAYMLKDIDTIFREIRPDIVIVTGISTKMPFIMAYLKKFGASLGYYSDFKLIDIPFIMMGDKKISRMQDAWAGLWMSRMYGIADKRCLDDIEKITGLTKDQLAVPIKTVHGWLPQSEYMKKRVLELSKRAFTGGLHVKKDEIRVAYSGVDTNFFVPMKKEAALSQLAKLNLNDPWFSKTHILQELASNKIILLLSRLSPEKGVMDFIYIWATLKRKYPGALNGYKVLLVGPEEKDYTELIRKAIREYGIADDIIYVGEQENKDTVFFHNVCDFFVSTSYREAFPRTVREAMSCGKLVIGRGNTGTKEVIKMCGGLLMSPVTDIDKDAKVVLKAIKMSDAKKKKIGDKIRERIRERLDVKRVSAEFLREFEKMLI